MSLKYTNFSLPGLIVASELYKICRGFICTISRSSCRRPLTDLSFFKLFFKKENLWLKFQIMFLSRETNYLRKLRWKWWESETRVRVFIGIFLKLNRNLQAVLVYPAVLTEQMAWRQVQEGICHRLKMKQMQSLVTMMWERRKKGKSCLVIEWNSKFLWTCFRIFTVRSVDLSGKNFIQCWEPC